MGGWFDLPQELKQIILSMVTDSDAIIYAPRDRRYKVNRRYQEAYHFCHILLVSKTFVAPNELDLALLGTTSTIKFRSSNELKRLFAEAKPALKDRVNRIHLERSWVSNNKGVYGDSFDGFSSIKETLSNNFPNLKKIYVSFPEWCAHVGDATQIYRPLHVVRIWELLNSIFSTEPPDRPIIFNDKAPCPIDCVVAAFIGDRNNPSPSLQRTFSRPQAWLCRLVRYAEEASLEVIFQLKLCIWTDSLAQATDVNAFGPWLAKSCFSTRRLEQDSEDQTLIHPYKRLHIDGEMSTKDWILRVRHKERDWKSHQRLGYKMTHAPRGQSTMWWEFLTLPAQLGIL